MLAYVYHVSNETKNIATDKELLTLASAVCVWGWRRGCNPYEFFWNGSRIAGQTALKCWFWGKILPKHVMKKYEICMPRVKQFIYTNHHHTKVA